MENTDIKEVRTNVDYERQPIIIQQPSTNAKGVVGFVLALLTIFLFWTPILGTGLGLTGLIFSILGLSKEPRGLAIAGLIISLIMLPVVLLSYIGWKIIGLSL